MNDSSSDKSTRDVLEQVADSYDTSSDFDIVNTMLAWEIFKPDCTGKEVLEVGCGMGEMTECLIGATKYLTVVEPTLRYTDAVSKKWGDRLKVHRTTIDDFQSTRKFQVIVLAGLLHHLPNPARSLRHLRSFLENDGVILATTPNSSSLHRQIGVQAGLLQHETSETERNRRFHQFNNFSKETLVELFQNAGYKVVESFGFMLKPFSSEQMTSLALPWEIIKALNHLGKANQHLSSQLFVKAESN